MKKVNLANLIDAIISNEPTTHDDKEYSKYLQFLEMSAYENDLINQHITLIAGLDEAGRGPLAGPVVAGCCILPHDFYLPGLNDSKKLTAKKRDEFYEIITKEALTYGVGIVDETTIDEINIYQATKLAMFKAVLNLNVKPEHLLIDALYIDIDIPQTSIIKGDQRSISIAAASIIAKVTRDRLMDELNKKYPEYNFHSNKGYATKEHIEALYKYGPCPVHRKSFEPVCSIILKERTLFTVFEE